MPPHSFSQLDLFKSQRKENLMSEIFTDSKTEELRSSTFDMTASPIEKRLLCGVMNCRWHDGVSRCNAPSVEVGPGYARSSVDTVCATFEPKVLM